MKVVGKEFVVLMSILLFGGLIFFIFSNNDVTGNFTINVGESCGDDVCSFREDISSCAQDCRFNEVKIGDYSCDSQDALTINPNSDMDLLNSPEYNIFCLESGRYPYIYLDSSGTRENPRVIKYLNSDLNYHPWNVGKSDRATLTRVVVDGQNWIFNGITISPKLSDLGNPTQPTGEDDWAKAFELNLSSEHIVINNILAESEEYLEKNNQGAFNLIQIRGDDHVVQNSVIRNGLVANGIDEKGIHIIRAYRTKVINNEIYNHDDAIRVFKNSVSWWANASWNPEGTVIANNEIYVNEELFADCSTGKLDPNGKCSCTENALDIKLSSWKNEGFGEDERMYILDNILYGFKRSAANESNSTGPGSFCQEYKGGTPVAIHWPSSNNMLIEGNIIFDTTDGISIVGNPVGNGPGWITVRNNILYNIKGEQINGVADLPVGYPLIIGGQTHNTEIYYNSIISPVNRSGFMELSAIKGDNEHSFGRLLPSSYDIRGNLLVNYGLFRNGFQKGEEFVDATIGQNAYFNIGVGDPPFMCGDVVCDPQPSRTKFLIGDNLRFPDDSGAKLEPYCFTIHKFTAPEIVCINVKPSEDSEFVDLAPRDIGSRKNIGIDDKVGIKYDFFGNSRDVNPDYGAIEYLPPYCGDGIVNLPDEKCDGKDLNRKSCDALSYSGGNLACNNQCEFEVSSCYVCGNGICEESAGENEEICSIDCAQNSSQISYNLLGCKQFKTISSCEQSANWDVHVFEGIESTYNSLPNGFCKSPSLTFVPDNAEDKYSKETCGYYNSCSCKWDDSSGLCKNNVVTKRNGNINLCGEGSEVKQSYCSTNLIKTLGSCERGSVTLVWNAIFFDKNGEALPFSENPSWCKAGTKVILCSVNSTKVPFFGLFGFVLSLMIILVYYFYNLKIKSY